VRLRLTTPTEIIVDREVTYVQAEDPSGRFGILPGHESYPTALVPSVLVYKYEEGGRMREAYAALRRGVLRVTGETVQVAVRDARVSTDLAELQQEVRRSREDRAARSYRSTRSLYQMQIAAWRRLLEYKNVRP
jgi:F-type H+-transporting ATPase subunit epsilon